jgi:multidrug resistance efflux pump
VTNEQFVALRAENERLKECCREASDKGVELAADLAEAQAENERLKPLVKNGMDLANLLQQSEADLSAAQERIKRYEKMERRANNVAAGYCYPTVAGTLPDTKAAYWILAALDGKGE